MRQERYCHSETDLYGGFHAIEPRLPYGVALVAVPGVAVGSLTSARSGQRARGWLSSAGGGGGKRLMGCETDYDTDILLWSEQQAEALRRRSANSLDWENLAEE